MVYVLAGNNTDNCNSDNPVRRATLYAFDAVTGKARWTASTTGPARCTTASPVVVGQWVYAPGLDGKVHRYAAGSGKEYLAAGWPLLYTLMPDVEKVAADLTATSRYLYVTTSGYIGDSGHYEGHLVTIDLRSGHENVFNSLCSNFTQLLGSTSGRSNYCDSQQSGLFGRGEGVVDPLTRDVYIVSGNGPWNGHTNWGDSVLKLNPSGSRLLDSFTPPNQASLNVNDEDLGSTGPALLPPLRAHGHTYHLLVQGGKGSACDGCSGTALRLLNRDNLSGHGGLGYIGGDLADAFSPGKCEVLTAPAVWRPKANSAWVFYANNCGVDGYRIVATKRGFSLRTTWMAGNSGTTPVLHHGALYIARSGHLTVYAAGSGKTLWDSSIGNIHWEYPLIAGGRLYLTDESGHLTALAIKG